MNSNSTQQWPYVEANYNDWQAVLAVFPHLNKLNPPEHQHNSNAQAIVIRSGNDDNVHKAIKYGIWTTTPKNKNKIQQLWHRKLNHNTDTYLFFSAVKSGMFQGAAVLRSGYHEQTFPFWWQNHTLKFKGYFKIEWVYIKDVNNKHFSGMYNTDGEEVIRSKDCDIVDCETTNRMLELFAAKKLKRNIFSDFAFMDEREREYTRKMYEVAAYYNQYPMGYGGYNGYSNGYQNNYQQNNYQQNNYQPNNYQHNNYNGANNYQNSYSNGQASNQTTIMGNSLGAMGQQPSTVPQPIMRPNVEAPGSNLGFQMNPVSKNSKKK